MCRSRNERERPCRTCPSVWLTCWKRYRSLLSASASRSLSFRALALLSHSRGASRSAGTTRINVLPSVRCLALPFVAGQSGDGEHLYYYTYRCTSCKTSAMNVRQSGGGSRNNWGETWSSASNSPRIIRIISEMCMRDLTVTPSNIAVGLFMILATPGIRKHISSIRVYSRVRITST